MTKGHVFIAASLDGYIARLNGDLDWLMKQKTDGEDHGYEAFMASVDGIVMGRRSFEKVLTFDDWPYQKPVLVMTSTLSDSDVPTELRERVRVSNGAPRDVMAELERDGWRHVYVDGGKLIQSFLQGGLIADITLTHIPILLGKGLPLFGALIEDVDLHHEQTKTFPSGLVRSTYRVA